MPRPYTYAHATSDAHPAGAGDHEGRLVPRQSHRSRRLRGHARKAVDRLYDRDDDDADSRGQGIPQEDPRRSCACVQARTASAASDWRDGQGFPGPRLRRCVRQPAGPSGQGQQAYREAAAHRQTTHRGAGVMDATLLGNLVAYSAQVALLVVVGAGLAALVRVDAAGVRYVYWRALLALCLILPWLPVRRSVVVTIADTVPIALLPSSSLPVGAQTAPLPVGITDWVSLLGWVIVAGAVLRVCWVGLGLWRLRRLRQAATIAPPCLVHEESQELVRARAEIRYVSSGQPVTFGFRRPVVLLPEMLCAQPEAIQQVVLCHELFHVRRRDWIWVVAEEIVKAALWFHPAVLWLVARVRLAREEVVDELTVLATA